MFLFFNTFRLFGLGRAVGDRYKQALRYLRYMHRAPVRIYIPLQQVLCTSAWACFLFESVHNASSIFIRLVSSFGSPEQRYQLSSQFCLHFEMTVQRCMVTFKQFLTMQRLVFTKGEKELNGNRFYVGGSALDLRAVTQNKREESSDKVLSFFLFSHFMLTFFCFFHYTCISRFLLVFSLQFRRCSFMEKWDVWSSSVSRNRLLCCTESKN